MFAGLKRLFLKGWMLSQARRGPPVPSGPRKQTVRRITLWQFGGLGDMLLATPVIEALHQAYPDAAIHIWCSNPSFAEFLQRYPAVQAIQAFPVYSFDSRTLLRSDVRREFVCLGDAMASESPDMLVNLHVPALLDWWAVEWRLARRLMPAFSLGFDPRFIQGKSIFNVSVNAAERDGIHYTQLYQRLLEKAGIPCGKHTSFPVTDGERKAVSMLLDEAGLGERRLACMHMGARRLKVENRMWPAERFAELAARLAAEGIVPVLTGVESEREMASELCERVPQCANLIGRTDPGELAALIARCDVFVGHDSGPFHVAAAVETPCVAICGRSDAEPEYLDYRRDDVLVFIADSPMEIAVDDVFDTVMRMLADG